MRALLFAASTLSLALAGPALGAPANPAAPAGDLTPAAVAALAPLPAGRLTDAATPAAYWLDLTVDPARERFAGHVEIEAQLKTAASFIDLHGRDLAVSKVVAVLGDRTVAGHWTQLDPTGVARVTFGEALPAGPVRLAFDYEAGFQSGPAGLFRVKVGDDWYSWTQFESIDARAAFPGFDQPGFKTPFHVTLRTAPGQVAVSNAPQVSSRLEGGLEVHTFAPTLPLPTYLVAMMVGPFATLEGQVPPSPQRAAPLPLRIVTTRQNAGKIAFALEGSKDIVRHLEAYFDQPFPYPKLDQITTPILPGAMENAGADLYGENILVLDDKATTGQKRSFGMIVSHELAHQWYGDLVTPAWWDDIWLNESFANWMGFRIGGEWRPDLNIRAGALAEGFAAMGTDALVAGRAIHQPITTNAQIDEAFDSITYGKGGHVIAMIAGYMGDDKFKGGVRRYMAAHKYGNATSTEFFAALADAAGDPRIVPAMQSFTDQQGVPLLSFARAGKGAWQVTQSRYARLGASPAPTRWGVPLCLRALKGVQQCQLLTEPSAQVAFAAKGPFIPNAGGTGYYRFELPAADWDALIAKAATLPGAEALALDDSLYASFLAGRASARQLVTSARQLARNPDSYASDAGIDSLQAFYNNGIMDEAGKAGYRRFLTGLLAPRLRQLGFDPRAGRYAGEDPEISLQRQQIVGRMVGTARDAALRAQLLGAATAYLGGDAQALDPAWYGDALGVWLEAGGSDAARMLADKALASQDPRFRPAALGVIAGSGQPQIARWVLDDLRDARLRPSERNNAVRAVIMTPETRDLGFDWLRSHFDELTSGSGGIFFTARLPGMVAGFCSAERADEVAALLGPRFAGKTGALELERTLERVRSCAALKTARSAELSAELAKAK